MKLFLCAHSIYSEIQEGFEEFVGSKCKDLSVAFVTTAANPYEDRSWEAKDIEFTKELFKSVDLYDIENMTQKEMVEKFSNYDILWINGGNVSYLMKKFREKGLDEVLPEILKNTVYVGSSAGSMVWSKSLRTAEWYLDDPEPGASKIPGIGLLDFQIYPHYEDSMFEDIKKFKLDNEELWLMRNGQAISYCDGDIRKYGGDILILPKE